jgi:AraC-like DNA-binding protein
MLQGRTVFCIEHCRHRGLPTLGDVQPVTQATPDTSARLWLPRLALGGCVSAAMLRNTQGLDLQGDDLRNYFPASPLMSLVWLFKGSGEAVVESGFADWGGPAPVGPLTLCGPFPQPSISRNHGPVHALQLLFQPDALQALLGLDPAAHVNRVCDAHAVLPSDWRAWAQEVAGAGDDATRLALIENFLLPRWQPIAHGRAIGRRYKDWSEGLALRAATSATGRSLRQIERRIKGWAGLPLRELRAIARGEAAFLDVMQAEPAAAVSWADVANSHGYADQSHLCRETRRLTGFAPAELHRRIQSDPAFWAYRLWM